MVVLDANVLLSAYRFAPTARNELLSVLEKMVDRIWIPHRVAEEFHRNRLKVIGEYDDSYLPIIESLQSFQSDLNSDIQPKIAQLSNRAALSDSQREKLVKLVSTATDAAISTVEQLRRSHNISSPEDDDIILSRFQEIFDKRTGNPLGDKELEEAIAEAQQRITSKIPPGYADAGKIEPYGDYLLWKQSLIEAKNKKVQHLLFVTSDIKEDWYLRIKGKTVCARPELAKELADSTGARLIMMSTTSLLHHARDHLNVTVSPETLRQADAIPDRRTSKQRDEIDNIRERRQSLLTRQDIIQREMAVMDATISNLRQQRYRDLEQDEPTAARRRYREAQRKMTDLVAQLESVSAELDTLTRNELKQATDRLDIMNNAIAEYRMRAAEIQYRIDKEKSRGASSTEIAEMEEELTRVQTRHNKLEAEASRLYHVIGEAPRKTASASRKIEE